MSGYRYKKWKKNEYGAGTQKIDMGMGIGLGIGITHPIPIPTSYRIFFL